MFLFLFRGAATVRFPEKSILWQLCAKVLDSWECTNIDCTSGLGEGTTVCSKLLAARAFMTLACIFSIISGISQFARLLEKIDSNQLLTVVIKVAPVMTLVMGIIGVAIGIPTILEGNFFTISDGAIIGIVALVINLVGGVLAAAAL